MDEPMTLAKLEALVGTELNVSDWLLMTQERINAFAECTDDRQWIHVDVGRAAQGPLKSTVAHGFLVLSLLTHWAARIEVFSKGYKMVVNYGMDRVRFLKPVRPGDRIRNRAVLSEVRSKGASRILVKVANTIEIEGADKPALTAESLAVFFI
ncbi:MAG: MaoC family dehydratase [Candidatus Aminicenantales bacterium]|jgi:acyl dehydratase